MCGPIPFLPTRSAIRFCSPFFPFLFFLASFYFFLKPRLWLLGICPCREEAFGFAVCSQGTRDARHSEVIFLTSHCVCVFWPRSPSRAQEQPWGAGRAEPSPPTPFWWVLFVPAEKSLLVSFRIREKQHVPILPAQALLRNAGFGGGMMTTQTCPDPRHSVVWWQHPIPMPARGSKPSCHPTEICRSGERSPGDMPSIGRAGPTALPALGTGQLAGREMYPLAPPGHEVHAQLSPGEWPQTPPAAEMPRAEIRNPGAGRVGAPRCATARLPPSFPAAMGCCMPWFVCVWK